MLQIVFTPSGSKISHHTLFSNISIDFWLSRQYNHVNSNMRDQTRSILDELSNISFKKDKENVVESRASHIIESAIRLITYIRENFDPETAYKLEKRFHNSIKQMDSKKFSKGIARIKENKDVKDNVLKIKDGEYQDE